MTKNEILTIIKKVKGTSSTSSNHCDSDIAEVLSVLYGAITAKSQKNKVNNNEIIHKIFEKYGLKIESVE